MTNKINVLLGGEKIDPSHYRELELLFKLGREINGSMDVDRVFELFRFIQTNEVVGWRSSIVTKKILRLLFANNLEKPLGFYALFCPSYAKGLEQIGFRTDDVGDTTVNGLKYLDAITKLAYRLGFTVKKPAVIFFDLAVERAEKIIELNLVTDLETNFDNFRRRAHLVSQDFQIERLSELDDMQSQIGFCGIQTGSLGVPKELFDKVVWRGNLFYKLFGWREDQVRRRSEVICRSESFVGGYLRRRFPDDIFIYTPTMLERLFVYSGYKYKSNPLPIITIKKDWGRSYKVKHSSV